ncbi:unnamed protein product [Lepeophtheirus salmonis]|uniref:(salmon louse) hypothetical protein n=1 Tax=Lepeophtheirus salmonis TaxID=72036 RepID=A0A7R8HCB8_LEPSM|nr:unnamed protein product [Lepeophtheirus salmonis]CAF2998964.1 unnamed protein product [Lepeophtheirus salmonis]
MSFLWLDSETIPALLVIIQMVLAILPMNVQLEAVLLLEIVPLGMEFVVFLPLVVGRHRPKIAHISLTKRGASPPVICGMNSGEHMYVDSSEQCNELAFNLQGANARQMWNIKITQFSCDFDNLAPEGCTQYFFGSNTGIVKTYNFDGGQHLDNQNQRICVRRERGNCRICWTATADTDFELTGDLTKSIADGKCCGDGPANGGVSGTDCVIIPGASKEVDMKDLVKVAALGLCGGKFGSKDNQKAHKTICSMILPFNIRFLSDTFETSGVEKGKQPNGFKLSYKMRACT